MKLYRGLSLERRNFQYLPNNYNCLLYGEEDQYILFESQSTPCEHEQLRYNEVVLSENVKINLIAFAGILLLTLISIWWNEKIYFQEFLNSGKSMSYHFLSAVSKLNKDFPERYQFVEQLYYEVNHLPFCVLIPSNIDLMYQEYIKQSVAEQNHWNHNYVVIGNYYNYPIKTFKQVLNQIDEECEERSILFFAKEKLDFETLSIANTYFQNYRTWLLYSLKTESNSYKNENYDIKNEYSQLNYYSNFQNVEIIAVYKRVFDLIYKNDFSFSNEYKINGQYDTLFVMTALFELSRFYSYDVSESLLSRKTKSFMSVDKNTMYNKMETVKRSPYQPLLSLNQDYAINDAMILGDKYRIMYKYRNSYVGLWGELRESLYLPLEHSVFSFELQEMSKKTQIGTEKNTYIPLCLTVDITDYYSVESYKKLFSSIFAQNYTNYEIVVVKNMLSYYTWETLEKYIRKLYIFNQKPLKIIKILKHQPSSFSYVLSGLLACPKYSFQIHFTGGYILAGRQFFKTINSLHSYSQLYGFFIKYFNVDDEFSHLPKENNQYNAVRMNDKDYSPLKYSGYLRIFKTDLLSRIKNFKNYGLWNYFIYNFSEISIVQYLCDLAQAEHLRFPEYIIYFNEQKKNISKFNQFLNNIFLRIWLYFRDPVSNFYVETSEKTSIIYLLKKMRYKYFIYN